MRQECELLEHAFHDMMCTSYYKLTDYMILLYLQGVILNMLFIQSLIPKLNIYDILSKFLLFMKEWTLLNYRVFFRDKSVQSSIPNYFKNFEVSIICYKYNKLIRGIIFNFNKLVSDLDIETCTPDS